MGAWYGVIKKLKGHQYAYLQRTWRDDKYVRTENLYLGPVEEPQGSPEPRVRTGEGRCGTTSAASPSTGLGPWAWRAERRAPVVHA